MVLEQGDIPTTEAPTEPPTTWATSTTTASPILVTDSFKTPRLPTGNLSPNSASSILAPSSFKVPRFPSGKVFSKSTVPAIPTYLPSISSFVPSVKTTMSTETTKMSVLMRIAEEATSIIVVENVVTD